MKLKRWIIGSALCLGMCVSNIVMANIQLKVPENLIDLSDQAGQALWLETPDKYRQDYWPLAQYFVTEKGVAYCAPASIVMALNALGIIPKVAPEHYPYKLFEWTYFEMENHVLHNYLKIILLGKQYQMYDDRFQNHF